jgi:subtilisin-like proprotein convertase family protein
MKNLYGFIRPAFCLLLTVFNTNMMAYGQAAEPYPNTLTPVQKQSAAWVAPVNDKGRTPCQLVIAAFDTLQCIPVPSDTGSFFYFPVCLGDSTKFEVKGIYPESGTLYAQHDSLSTFYWNFGDGTLLITELPEVWHTYDTAKGFEMNFYILDSNDCMSNPVIARVVVTKNPINFVNDPPDICLYDTTTIMASTFTGYFPYSYSQSSSQMFDSTMFIPDGPNCDPTNPCYNTDVIFTSFLPEQTITSGADILSLCVMMEHSYVGDLNFRVICPNGQSDTLKTYIHQGGADMGIPGTPDSGCKPKQNPQGTPWNYCWSEIYPNIGTINNNCNQGRLDSTDRTNNIKYYLPDNPFNELTGCPLNGRWTIEICDKWAADNGYIFSWTLNLAPSLLPQSWGYTAPIDSTWVTGPFTIGTQGNATVIRPTAVGDFIYTVSILDNYGCIWDTTVYLHVNPLPSVNLGNDAIFCQGNQQVLDAGAGMAAYNWNTGATSRTLQLHREAIMLLKLLMQMAVQ